MDRKFTHRNEGFICVICGSRVLPLKSSCRNHCPFCLHSLHVDQFPGDRSSDCKGVLEPVGIDVCGKKGIVIHFRCQKCGFLGRNRAFPDASEQPDSMEAIIRLMRHIPS